MRFQRYLVRSREIPENKMEQPITSRRQKFTAMLLEIMLFVERSAGALWWFGRHHPPIITPNAYTQMQYYGISYKELIGAFHSSDMVSGYHEGSTCGKANYYGKVVGAVYKKDD